MTTYLLYDKEDWPLKIHEDNEIVRDLFDCIENAHIEELKLRISSAKEYINIKRKIDNGEEDFPLMVACSIGDIEIIKSLLNADADINVVNENGYSALHSACFQGHVEAVDYLTKYHANVNITNHDGLKILDELIDDIINKLEKIYDCEESEVKDIDEEGAIKKLEKIIVILLNKGGLFRNKQRSNFLITKNWKTFTLSDIFIDAVKDAIEKEDIVMTEDDRASPNTVLRSMDFMNTMNNNEEEGEEESVSGSVFHTYKKK